jgi:hypothetical protein
MRKSTAHSQAHRRGHQECDRGAALADQPDPPTHFGRTVIGLSSSVAAVDMNENNFLLAALRGIFLFPHFTFSPETPMMLEFTFGSGLVPNNNFRENELRLPVSRMYTESC